MRRALASKFAAPIVAATVLAAVPAHADGLRIETLEHATWPDAVAALQRERDSESHVIHVVVKAGGADHLVPCGGYGLALDAVAAEAFAIETCDPDSAATTVRLVHRRALFDHNDAIARPRAPGITATRVQVGGAAGGAKLGAESAVSCSADVHPFIRDLESGERVELTPGRYELRARGEGVTAMPAPHGWTIKGPAGSRATADYEVVDTKRAEVVLRDRVTLACSVEAEPTYADASTGHTNSGFQHVVIESIGQHEFGTYTPGQHDEASAHDGEWNGHAFSVGLNPGLAFLRVEQASFSNGNTSSSGASIGLRDTPAPVLGISAAFERPGIYTSLGAAIASASEDQRVLVHMAIMSTVAASLHIGDTTLFLGPAVHVGTTRVSAAQSSQWDYGSPIAFSLGAAAGLRLHLRDEKQRAWVLGFDAIAPVAGQAPWFLTASIGFGDAK